jgi:hypothetical protein
MGFLMVGLSLLAGQLFYKIFDLNFWFLVSILIMWFLFIKLPKKFSWILLLILFFTVLSINKLFSLHLNPLNYNFNWEKIVWTHPDYLKLIDRYWHQDLWLLFKLRNLFYSSWLLIFSWLDLVFKLISPIFLVRMLGFSGFSLTFFGIIQFFKSKQIFWPPLFWWLIVVMASGFGMLTDSKSSLILDLPAIIYFMYLGTKNKIFNKYQKFWWLLLLIDILLK